MNFAMMVSKIDVHLPFIFRSFDLFVASLLLMKGISYCAISRKLEPIDCVKANCCFVEFDTSIICHVLVYCFGSFLLQDLFLSLQVFAFITFTVNVLLTRILYSVTPGPAMIRAVCEYSRLILITVVIFVLLRFPSETP